MAQEFNHEGHEELGHDDWAFASDVVLPTEDGEEFIGSGAFYVTAHECAAPGCTNAAIWVHVHMHDERNRDERRHGTPVPVWASFQLDREGIEKLVERLNITLAA